MTKQGLKAIEEIQVGDQVLSYNDNLEIVEYKDVVEVYNNETTELCHIYTENEEIVCTPNHSILTDEGWKLASELTTNYMIKTSTGVVQVKSIEIEQLKEKISVYNLNVLGYHTYIVGNEKVVVHNKCGSSNIDDATIDYDDLLPNEKSAYDGYSKNGWQGNYKGQAKGTRAGGRWDNVNGQLPNNATYKEFDVNPPTPGIGRDSSRFLASNDGKIYLTRDHYETFFRIIKKVGK